MDNDDGLIVLSDEEIAQILDGDTELLERMLGMYVEEVEEIEPDNRAANTSLLPKM